MEHSSKMQFAILLPLIFASLFALASTEQQQKLGVRVAPDEGYASVLGIASEHLEGLDEREVELPERDVTLHFLTNEEYPTGAKHVMVFVHGFPQFSYVWRHQLQHFKTEQIVYAFDLRGYGLSSRPEETLTYTIDSQLDDINAFVERVKKVHNLPVTLVTHDIGAAIGAMLQYKYSNLVKRFMQMNGPNPKSLDFNLFAKNLSLVANALHTPYFLKILQWQFPGSERILRDNNYKFVRDLFLDKAQGGVQYPGPNTLNATDAAVYVNSLAQAAKPGELDPVTSALNFYRAPLRQAAQNTKNAVKNLANKVKTIFTHNSGNSSANQQQQQQDGQVPVTKIKAKCLILWGGQDAAFGNEAYAIASQNACESGRLAYLEKVSHWVPEDVPNTVNEQIQLLLDN